jgi:hypothetical protein
VNELRPLERDDLEQVAALFLRVVRAGERQSVGETAAYFERTTLDHPWADPEIPALVFVDGAGAITGFVGSYVARLRFDGSPIRAACPGNLVAAVEPGAVPAGALLLREYLNGPQEVTFVDTLGESSRPMWQALGGETAFLGAFSWVRVFGPFGLASERLVGRRGAGGRVLPVVWGRLDAAVRRVGSRWLAADVPGTSARVLEPAAMVAEWPRLTRSLRLYPDYDRGYLEWLFGELERPRRRGVLVRRLVEAGGRVLGWYLYYLKTGGISRVLQVVGGEKDLGAVLDHLFHDAQAAGAAALDGRLEPRLLEPLAQRRCLFRYAGAAGVHTRNRDILVAVLSRQSVFTRIDSEYWPIPPRPRDSDVSRRR